MEKSGVPPAPLEGTGFPTPTLDAMYKVDALILALGADAHNFSEFASKLDELIQFEHENVVNPSDSEGPVAYSLELLKQTWVEQKIIDAYEVEWIFDTNDEDSRVENIEAWISIHLRDGSLALNGELLYVERLFAAVVGAGDMPLAQWLVKTKGVHPHANSFDALKHAAAHGRLEMFRWLQTPEPGFNFRFASSREALIDSVALAAKTGHWNIIEWVWERSFPSGSNEIKSNEIDQGYVARLATENAIIRRKISVLEWVMRRVFVEQARVPAKTIFITPFERSQSTKNLPLLRFYDILTGGINVVKWAVRSGMSISLDAMTYVAFYAAEHDDLDLLKWAMQELVHNKNSAEFTRKTEDNVILALGKEKHVKAMQWMLFGRFEERLEYAFSVQQYAQTWLNHILLPAFPGTERHKISIAYTIGQAVEREIAEIAEIARRLEQIENENEKM